MVKRLYNNGGIIGALNAPTLAAPVGIWLPNEIHAARGEALWLPKCQLVHVASPTVDTIDRAVYTFSGVNLGPVTDDRVNIILYGTRANAARSITGITLDAVTMSASANANATDGGADMCGIYALPKSSGSTGEFILTFSNTMLRCVIEVYALYGAGASATTYDSDSQTTNGTDIAGTIDVPYNGAALAACWANATSTTLAWTGLTEATERTVESTSNALGTAYTQVLEQSLSLAVSVDINSPASGQALAIASWEPKIAA